MIFVSQVGSQYRVCRGVGLGYAKIEYACPALSETRGLEDLLNTAWSTIAAPGEWLAFDAQIKHGETVFDDFIQIIKNVPSTVGIYEK